MKHLTTIAIFLISTLSYGQNENMNERRFISVTGSAEIVVSPDEIELEIVLKEYNDKDDVKIKLSMIESKFENILKKNKIDKKKVVFGNSEYYWHYWWNYRNDDYKRKKYNVKLDSSTDFLSFVQDLNFEGINSLRISNTSNKKLQKLRKEIKIASIRAAKEKAIYLLESIDEKVGRIISIEEIPANNNYYWRGNQNILSNAVISNNTSDEDIENIASIKIRYEVKTKFEIE